MRVAVRVDASPQIGIGHFMRTMTLASALGRRGASVRFLCGHLPDHLRALAADAGHGVEMLRRADVAAGEDDDLAHAHWLGSSQRADAAATVRALGDERWDWVIVDQYALDARWERAVRRRVPHILVIDDLADRAHDCDVLVDQNLYADMATRYAGKVPARCATLTGPAYSLLREEFRQLRARTGVRDRGVGRVHVLMGGMDSANETSKVIRALARLNRQPAVDVVIGAQHPARTEVEELCGCQGYEFHVQPRDLHVLMARADLAIGASGSTSWERCCLGLPTIVLTHAFNQVAIAEGLAQAGAVVHLGSGPELTEQHLAAAVQRLMDSPADLAAMSRAARAIVDGCGVERVLATMAEAA